MLEQGKKYRIKGTDERTFGFDDMGMFTNYTAGKDKPLTWYDIAEALAIDNYEEVKQTVKKTFYQAVGEPDGDRVSCACWYSTPQLARSRWVGDSLKEIITHEFEVEV